MEHDFVDWVASLGGVFPAFNRFVAGLALRPFFKGGVVVAAYWWLWSDGKDDQDSRRERLLAGLAGALAAALVNHLLVRVLPLRPRPAMDGSVDFHFEHATEWMVANNSFPSDHAALFAALAVGLIVVSRRVGIPVAAYVFAFVLLPRLYLGYHWPTDIVAGAALGVGCGLLAASRPVRALVRPVLRWGERFPGPAHGIFFLVSFEVANLFEDLRWLGSVLAAALGFRRGG